MKEKFESQYLNQKLEPMDHDQENDGKFVSNFYQFGEHGYEKENGKYEFKIGETEIFLEYSTPNFFDKFKDIFMDSSVKNKGECFKNVKKLESLILKKGGKRFALEDFFPDRDEKIYFNIQRDDNTQSSSIDIKNKTIFLEEDPLTPEGLLALGHEIGHYEDDLRSSKEYNKTKRKARRNISETFFGLNFADEDDAKTVIKEERDAWSFSLRNLRPFVDDLEFRLDGLDQEIHGSCLKSYSDYIRRKLDN